MGWEGSAHVPGTSACTYNEASTVKQSRPSRPDDVIGIPVGGIPRNPPEGAPIRVQNANFHQEILNIFKKNYTTL